MSWIATAVIGSAVVGGAMSSSAQTEAARTAAGAQTEAAELGISEQRRQFDEIQKLMAPYIEAGDEALIGQQALLGLSGEEAQQEAIKSIEDSPQFRALTEQGESALLQQASATGGLRGGNVQSALSQFRPQMLSNLIENQYAKLSGLSQGGRGAATDIGRFGSDAARNISGLLQEQGAAQAGQALAQGQATSQFWGDVTESIGTIGGRSKGQFGVF